MTVKRKTLIANFEVRSVMLIAACTLGAAGHAMAQSSAAPMASEQDLSAQFVKADRDGNKSLNVEEAATLSVAPARFMQMDINKDGALSAEEFTIAMKGDKKPAQ